MNEIKYLNAFRKNGPFKSRLLSLTVCIYLLEHGPTSTAVLADMLDADMPAVTKCMTSLKREGWLIKKGADTVYGLAPHGTTGKLTKTIRNCGVYAASEKLRETLK